jgi:hypothetical protein
MRKSWLLCAALALASGAVACHEEGPAERAGRKFDKAVDELRHGKEGELEKAGRKIDEAVDDASEAVSDAVDDASDAVDDARKDAAKKIEGD